MGRIEDFIEGIYPGSGEVKIPKNFITEPMVGWTRAFWYLPKDGCIASYRKDRFHLHEMNDHYCVHIDKVNPATDPIGHLVEDAPQVIVWGTVALALGALIYLAIREPKKKEKAD